MPVTKEPEAVRLEQTVVFLILHIYFDNVSGIFYPTYLNIFIYRRRAMY